MAKATTRFVDEQVVTTLTKQDGVVLELTQDEAQFLMDILCCVGGSPSDSRRKYERSITDVLNEAGVHWNRRQTDLSGVISCSDIRGTP